MSNAGSLKGEALSLHHRAARLYYEDGRVVELAVHVEKLTHYVRYEGRTFYFSVASRIMGYQHALQEYRELVPPKTVTEIP